MRRAGEEEPGQEAAWTAELSGERVRIARLCARLTGNWEAAEDLAQETLIEAWRCAPRLRDESVWQSFVAGIARNLCQRWLRQSARERSVRVLEAPAFYVDSEGITISAFHSAAFELARDPFDMEEVIETNARNAIVDRALGAVSGSMRRLLQERYLDDQPLAEIAGRNGLSENAAAVRIHRARAALRRVIVADPALAAEASAWGILPPPSGGDGDETHGGWQESRLWCPRCGMRQLVVRFVRDANGRIRKDLPNTPQTPLFGVRCLNCQAGLGFDFTSGHAAIDTRRLLAGISGFKPAMNRLDAWWSGYYDQAIRKRECACPICGRAADAFIQRGRGFLEANCKFPPRGLFIRCRTCGRGSYTTATGVAVRRPEVRAFYRRHPRVALIDEAATIYQNRPAISVSIGSVIDSARMEVLLDAADLTLLATHCRE